MAAGATPCAPRDPIAGVLSADAAKATGTVLIGVLFAGGAASDARADAKQGAQLARQWCSNCHVVAANLTGVVAQGPSSFASVARSGPRRRSGAPSCRICMARCRTWC
jgi:mono/diheme cytochrome c family protein